MAKEKKRQPKVERFTPEQEVQYAREARLQYGPDLVNQSMRRWNAYTEDKKDDIVAEGERNYIELVAAMEAGKSADDEDVQAILKRWHEHIGYFYEPTLDILRGLGEMYRTSPDFMAYFEKFHADLPDFIGEAIDQYVDDLEYDEIVRLLAEDDADQATG